ncbi:sorbosone dehydrogenase family protein [Acinetobacter sp. C_4_1]|uniref:PQQ-dependent sugar dehydrogenase n=1 Tax=unclassified Acinetobacter TaxID=196816 RepID=UPI0021B7B2B8|nr:MULTISPECIES: sorbosone dehydrogenase family protein [unclassified Acinetobacter]MCT8090271.1 sorbosone dehydrogenase family protein [Acinetobacter sp. F_3_1]MCT8098746.1 sorbosone dehydrogenase family protein [Acinetobacter sp. C_3_1]MCT8101766.1 sorbosone dehydrogenase family protein [Acinetobacter sp. C_4_1]MCT8135641.1 sorbosone dehydrogenase family protein [Acinetobacter sp. T_3_1]
MSAQFLLSLAGAAIVLAFTGCASPSRSPITDSYGPQPHLPEPKSSLFPTVNIAPAKGWPAGTMPTPAPGLKVQAFAKELEHPRWLYVLPNGDVLVAETDAPPKPDDSKGFRGKIMKLLMKRAGSSHPSANRIRLLRDSNGDGVAEQKTVFLQNLNSPFGMALVGNTLYVANTDALMRFPYQKDATQITAGGSKVLDLPGGPLNHHWTKNVIANSAGSKLYITVGSNSNVAENGLDQEAGRALIMEFDITSGKARPFATGLRNPNGMDWQPQSGMLWTVVNERDEIGNDLVPDYLTSVQDGAFYGWPYSYYGQHVDTRVKPQNSELVARAIKPDYALGNHTASLGLTFYTAQLMPQYRSGALIGQHGSWNRKPHSGYKVIFVPFQNGQPSGQPQDVLTGFLNDQGEAQGRPVGVAVDRSGAILVADDVGNMIWRISPIGTMMDNQPINKTISPASASQQPVSSQPDSEKAAQ